MPTLTITDVRIWNQQGQDATLFHPYFDAISLAVGVDISTDLMANLDNQYQVDFQIIDALTDRVIVNSFQSYQLPESWPSWWFTAGNNWGPNPSDYTTAERWGLRWTPPYIFGVRGILTAVRWTGSGFDTIDAFDVSPVRWFQILPIIGTILRHLKGRPELSV